MARIADLSQTTAQNVLEKDCPIFETTPFVAGPALAQRNIALVTTSGLHHRDDANFEIEDLSYRVIPGDVDLNEIVMSQTSVNFDRSGFQQDINVVFPLEPLRALEAAGEIGSIANYHYALNAAGQTGEAFAEVGAEIGKLLKRDNVDGVVLIPV